MVHSGAWPGRDGRRQGNVVDADVCVAKKVNLMEFVAT